MIDVTEEELYVVLNRFKELVTTDRYTISSGENRVRNDKFIENNFLTSKRIKKMLLELTTKDCVGIEKHYKDKNKIIYIFIKEYIINNSDGKESLKVYIKFLICLVRCQEHVVVISFHDVDRDKKYIFNMGEKYK